MKSSFCLSFALASLISAISFQSLAQDREYFPETGPRAIHQRALDLTSGATVLMVALQPGYEDLNLLARLRLGVGARTFVAYWTNGEDTPDDAGGASPGLLAGARREEAYRAERMLGAQVSYLNLPDPGVVSGQNGLLPYWNPDSTLQKLVPMIRSYAPDVIVINGDFRGDSVQSVRQRAATQLLLAGVKLAAREDRDSLHAAPWRVQRVVVQIQDGSARKEGAYDRIHPLWNKSYRAIATEAGREYRTLRYQLPSWLARGDRQYVQLFPSAGAAPKQLTAGLPVLVPRLKPMAAVVRRAAGAESKGIRSTSLPLVVHAIDSLSNFYAFAGSTIQPPEFRMISFWKNALEDLRCSLLDVSIGFQASDSLVTQGQIFYLKFTGMSSRSSKTHTTIFFPGVQQRRWGVNESAKYQYDFAPPVEYRVITPTPMDLNYPESQFGILRPFARTRFSFLINHQDSVVGHDFTYRGEVLLQAGPRRTFEVLTPAVRALEGEPVAYRLQNISRDAFEGSITLKDSMLNTATKKVFLSRKDEVLLDTLFLSFKQAPPTGTSAVTLSLSGMGGSVPVVIRKFDASTDSSAQVVLFSNIGNSPIELAMRRLRLPFRLANDIQPDVIAVSNVLVVDRDVLASRQLTATQTESIQSWVQRGGHLVVFPQGSSADRGASLVPWANFAPGPLSAPDDSVITSAGNELLTTPNNLTQADWSNWVVSRSLWSLRVPTEQANDVVVRTAHGQLPLLVTRKEGKGRITLVALDLPSQLMNLHPGVHRLLGNLLKSER